MKLKLALLVGLFAFGFAMSASAGAVADGDSDLVPNQFDNCSTNANGPNQGSNQIDSDLDGYGNACDADYNNTGATNVADFGLFLATFGTNSLGETDHNGSGTVNVADFGIFLTKYLVAAPGPSGLACALLTATTCTP